MDHAKSNKMIIDEVIETSSGMDKNLKILKLIQKAKFEAQEQIINIQDRISEIMTDMQVKDFNVNAFDIFKQLKELMKEMEELA